MINDYIESKFAGSSENTISTYRRILKSFENHLKNEQATFSNFIRDDVQSYIYNLENGEKAAKPSTVRLHVIAIKNFVRWMEEEKKMPNRIIQTSNLRYVEMDKNTEPKSLTKNEMNRLLRAVGEDAKYNAISRILLSCGLRLTELTSLNVSDIEIGAREESNIIHFIGKGNKQRHVNFKSETKAAIKWWLLEREEIISDLKEKEKWNGDPNILFISELTGKRLTGRAIQTKFQRIGKKKIDVPGLHPHMLRHTCFTHMIERGASINDVQAISGHSDNSTDVLMKYIRTTPEKASKFQMD